MVLSITFSSTTWLLFRTSWTRFGWSICRKLRRRLLKSSSTRATLMPPPVDPADAPMTISTSRMVLEKLGHRSKSVVAKPEVVMMLDTWKAA